MHGLGAAGEDFGREPGGIELAIAEGSLQCGGIGAALLKRLARVRGDLEGTRFAFREHNSFVEVTSPWGNRLRCHEPEPRFGRITLGLPYVEFAVPPGTIEGMGRFYRTMLETPAELAEDEHGRHLRVGVGARQFLLYRETDAPLPAYDGHHVQIYVADFSGAHRRLLERGLVFEESDQHQYRFKDILDPESGRLLYTIEHEVRSMRHPLYARPLVNRNPAQTNRDYAPGHDSWRWAMTSDGHA